MKWNNLHCLDEVKRRPHRWHLNLFCLRSVSRDTEWTAWAEERAGLVEEEGEVQEEEEEEEEEVELW